MKRKLVIAMITTGLSTMNTSSEFNSFIPVTSNPITVDNQMGRGPNCLGRGLCTLTGGGQASRNPDAQFSSELSFDDRGNIVMTIDRQGLPDDVFLEQFQDNEFILVDSFDLPAEITQAMGVKSTNYAIPEGVYPVLVSDTEVTVVFDLRLR